MKIVKLKGGLGNQLFQYAFGKVLEDTYGVGKVKYDLSCFLALDNHKTVSATRLLEMGYSVEPASEQELKDMLLFGHDGYPFSRRYRIMTGMESLLNKRYYFEKDRAPVDVAKILLKDYFDGYWQSWRYIYSDDLLSKRLEPKIAVKGDLLNRYDIDLHSAFIGIRCGDYTTTKKKRNHFGSYDESYFQTAIRRMGKKTYISQYHIFSNDIGWVKSNLNFGVKNIIFHDDKSLSDIEEFYLMMNCANAIIVNSTFYWWAAWFIKYPEKVVIAPKEWFHDGKPIDIVPPDWIQL